MKQFIYHARCLFRYSWRLSLKRNLPRITLLKYLKHTQNIYQSPSIPHFIKPKPLTKAQYIMQGQSQQCQFFISDLNKSNKNKFLYLSGSVLQIWIALQATVLVPYFLLLVFGERVTLQFQRLYKDYFCKKLLFYGIRKTVEIFVEFYHQFFDFFYMNSRNRYLLIPMH